ncbi:MAG: ribonuclease T2 family protein [Mycobacterium sp.]
MRRGDAAVLSISTALAAVVIAAVTFSLVVLDRAPSSTALRESTDASVLVVTWGPSLCRVDPANLGCTSGHVAELGRTWILHGLWPQPEDNQYCGPRQSSAELELSDDVRARLQSMMSDVAALAPHEWSAHGTCSGVTPDAYFSYAAALTDQARAVLEPLLADADGSQVSQGTLSDAVEAAFGDGAGQRVGVVCRNVNGEGSVIYEVHLSLPPVAQLSPDGETPSLGALLAEGPAVAAGCRHGRVV